MRTVVRWCVTPFMKGWVASQQSTNRYVPRPLDDPHVHAPGPDPRRLLIFGSGPAMGWGVVSHDIALPGSLARTLTARTGHGTDVDVIAQQKMTAGTALRTLSELELESYAGILVTLGVRDALALVSATRWRDELVEITRRLVACTSPEARYFFVGVPPISSVPGFNTRLGRYASQHADELNRASVEFCRATPRCVFVPISAADAPVAPAERDGRTYRNWAAEIADIVAPELVRADDPGTDAAVEHGGRS